MVRAYVSAETLVAPALVLNPELVILFFQSGKATVLPPQPGVFAEAFGCCSQALIAFANLLQAPLSELYGRKPVIITSMLILMIFCLACGFATSSDQLIAFRVFAGFGGSVPFALTAPIIGDVYDAHNRGSALAWSLALEMAGPAVSNNLRTSGHPI